MNTCYGAFMNTDKLARATFVLDRSTVQGLAYLSRRLQRSRSELVREVLGDPIDGMVTLLRRHPEGAEVDPRQLALDGLNMIESAALDGLAAIRMVAGNE